MRDLLRWLTHGGQEDPLPPPLVYLIPLAGGSLSILLRPAQNTQDVQLESFWFADLPDESVAQLLIQESFDKNGEGEYHGYIPGVFSIESTELDAASCHGRFDPFNPLNSSLELSNEESLTLYDILNQEPRDQTRLVVLSACQTGVSDVFHLADGLSWPTAFLRLGVPGIIGTCWPATTGAAALLMAKFYELLFKGDGLSGGRPTRPAQALCSAQRWLRALTWEEAAIALGGASAGLGPGSSPAPGPFNAPLYWALFIFVGV